MLKLRRVAALDIDKRGIGIDDPVINQVFEGQEVALFPGSIEVSATEGERSEFLVDGVEQCSCLWCSIIV
jgi:hypothetical protein